MRVPKLPPGDLSSRNRALVAMLPWRIEKLKDLPTHYHRALVAHGIWPRPVRKFSEESPTDFLLQIWSPSKKFGLVNVGASLMKLQVMNDPDRRNSFTCFEEYHNFYKREDTVPKHPAQNRWPIFLSGVGRDRETIWDGWHRFHSYIASDAQDLPIIWYADEQVD